MYWEWYCEDTRGSKIVRDIGTGILPEVLLVVWQALLLPRVLYYLGQARPSPDPHPCAVPALTPTLYCL